MKKRVVKALLLLVLVVIIIIAITTKAIEYRREIVESLKAKASHLSNSVFIL